MALGKDTCNPRLEGGGDGSEGGKEGQGKGRWIRSVLLVNEI